MKEIESGNSSIEDMYKNFNITYNAYEKWTFLYNKNGINVDAFVRI
ncbi:MAG: hypothetical protein GX962_04965 [Epulopiscium sp.]|nr:hypothetical protein [Candidatus Epulonipiscium sp.]